MAVDWIKMRTDLYRDPKVCLIADMLIDSTSELSKYINQQTKRDMTVTRNVMRHVTVGALVSVWGVLRHRGKRHDDDLHINNCGSWIVDDIADIPGFGEAMMRAGWLVEDKNDIVFPRFFEEFNVDPEENMKIKNAERQRKYREKHKEESNANSNVTVTSQSNVREEKRRDSKHTCDDVPEFNEFWSSYPRKVAKPTALKSWLKQKPPIKEVLFALTQEKRRWTDPQYIPHPSTWLNQRRWEDVMEVTQKEAVQDKVIAMLNAKGIQNVVRLPNGTYQSGSRYFGATGMEFSF